MLRSKTLLLCALLLAISAAVHASITMQRIYPSSFFDNGNLLVENSLMVTLQEIDDNNGWMKVYDAENPALPLLQGSLNVPYRNPRKAFLHDAHVYIPDNSEHRLRRYSLFDPANPVLNYEYAVNMVGYRDLAFSGNYLLMSTQSLGLRIINISAENSATEVGSFTDNHPLFRVWAHENRAAVLSYNLTSETAVLKILDISNPASPVYTGAISLPDYDYEDPIEVVFYQNFLFLEQSGCYTKVYDLAIPNVPEWLGYLEFGMGHSVILDNIRYSHRDNVFRVQQLTEPLNQEELAAFDLFSIDDERCLIDLPYAYIIREGYSYCLDLSELVPPEPLVYTFETAVVYGEGLAARDDWLYYTGNIAQLNTQDEIVGAQPCAALADARDLKVQHNSLHTTSWSGLASYIFNLADPADPQLLSTISGSSGETWRYGNIFIIRGTNGLRYYDVSDPTNPVYWWTLNRNAKSLAMEGDLLWIVWQGVLETYRVSAEQPLLICSQPIIPSTNPPQLFTPTLAKHGSYIYISGYSDQTLIYDVSNPYASTYAGSALVLMPGDASDRPPFFTPDGQMLIVTGFANQVILYNLDDPEAPEYIAHHRLPYKPSRIVFRGERFLFKRENIIYCLQMPGTVSSSDPALNPPVVQVRCQPNPFSSQSLIRINNKLATSGEVAVYNLKGQKIRILHTGILPAGNSEFVWDGRDERGGACSSGIYLVRLQDGGRLAGTAKVTLLK